MYFRGDTGSESFDFDFKNYNRQTRHTQPFHRINGVRSAFLNQKSSFTTDYSGFIGIQPYTKDETKKFGNFLY